MIPQEPTNFSHQMKPHPAMYCFRMGWIKNKRFEPCSVSKDCVAMVFGFFTEAAKIFDTEPSSTCRFYVDTFTADLPLDATAMDEALRSVKALCFPNFLCLTLKEFGSCCLCVRPLLSCILSPEILPASESRDLSCWLLTNVVPSWM